MKRLFTSMARIAAGVALALTALVAFGPAPRVSAATSALEFRSTMRKLWEDHITWTRLYIVSAAAGLPDLDATTQRLLQNQVDLGNAIKPFYGDAAGNQLTALLKDHILGAADLIAAAKAGDKAKTDAASAKWYANADQIAGFLNGANPKNFPLGVMKDEMKMHLDLTLKEATDRLQGKYADDIKDYDQVHLEILGMADALSNGIMAQFPDQFDSSTLSGWTLHSNMRKLWEDHITWTRLYIVSAAAGLPDADLTAQRLLQNQVDLGNAIKPVFGNAAGDKLTGLLKDHILGAADLIAAAKAGDTAKTQAASAKWYANANEIAAFFNSADAQAFPLAAMQDMMKMHLDLTLKEATDRLQGKFADDIQDYDQVHAEILSMSDMLTAGVQAHVKAQASTPTSTGGAPAALPTTGGGDNTPLLALGLLVGLALLAIGGQLWLANRVAGGRK